MSPALSILLGHLGNSLLYLGGFSKAEASLMVALDGMGHEVNLTKTAHPAIVSRSRVTPR